jgi:hypothetical protein
MAHSASALEIEQGTSYLIYACNGAHLAPHAVPGALLNAASLHL